MQKLVIAIAIRYLPWLVISPFLAVSAYAQGTLDANADAHDSDGAFAKKMKAAEDLCLKAYGVNDPKFNVMRRLLPIFDEVPITLQVGSITQAMLRLDRKPNQEEKVALNAYYDAEMACVQARAKVMAWAGNGEYTQDPSTGIPKGWERDLDQIRGLMDGKVTFAEFNAEQKHERDLANVQGRKALAEAIAENDRSAASANTSALDAWYRQSVDLCAGDDECKWIVSRTYEDSIACNRGDAKGCSDRDADNAEIVRWSARQKTAAPQAAQQAAPQNALMQCLQDALKFVVASCTQHYCDPDVEVVMVKTLQEAQCGYSAISQGRSAPESRSMECTTMPLAGGGSKTTCGR